MGSRLLNGLSQLSVRVTLFPLILIVLSLTVTLGTLLGVPTIINHNSKVCDYLHMYNFTTCTYVCMYKHWHVAMYVLV